MSDIAAKQAYQTLVHRLAAGGDDPEVTELRAALFAVGGTMEQLLADVDQRRQDRIELESLRIEQREDAEDQYSQLVLAAADGFDIDSSSADAILSAAQRSADEFMTDVRKLTGVRRQRAFSEMVWQAKIDDAYRTVQQRCM